MDDLIEMLDEVLAGLSDTDSLPVEIDLDDEVHWAPVQSLAGLPPEIADVLELQDAPPSGKGNVMEGVQWAAFPNPFQKEV
ncbi:hypothetical protein [Streptomyces sp. NPDC001652]|uniref:hypothetical protein n=1 Tax=Streptomyces sp. NPDC001652 TaxID=3154393 RepID=UPI00332636FE